MEQEDEEAERALARLQILLRREGEQRPASG